MYARSISIKILVLLLVFGQVFTVSEAAFAAGESSGATDTLIDLGTPIQTAQTIDAAYGKENGVNVVYTTVTGSASSGDWARLNVIDIDNQRLLGSYPLEGASNAWSHVIAPDGRVFIGATKNMFVYTPETKEVTNLGVPLQGTESIWALTSDEYGNIYGGIYSASVGGRVFKVDAGSLEITDVLGTRVDSNENYIRSIAYYDGHVYAGTGSTNGRVWKINPRTKEKERLELPGSPNDPIYNGLYDKMGFVYGMTVVDNYLYAFFNGPSTLHVYDLDKQEWRDKGLRNFRGTMAVTGQHNGKVYTSKKDGNMWEIDIETLDERIVMPFDGSIRNSAWMDVKNQPEFDGKAMVTISYDGKVILFDPPNQKRVVMRSLVEGQATNLQAMEAGPDGKVYISSYMGTTGAIYDPGNNDELSLFPLAQAEGFGSVGETLYFGVYPKAEIFGYDTTKPMPDKGPSLLFDIGKEQDRPFVLREGAGKLLIGTISGYSAHGGALTIYDPDASEATGQPVFEAYRNIVENQSIAGLAYKDGLVFGSTTIHGGLGSDPISDKAKLFTFDMETKKKLDEWDLELDGLSNTVPMISGLTVGPDGLIWGTANGFIFAFDPETYEVVKSKNVYPNVTNFGRWRPMKLYWGIDGLLYTNVADTLTVINPETMDSIKIEDNVSIFAINNDNDLYFAKATRVFKKLAEKPTDIKVLGPNKLTVNEPQDLRVEATLYGWNVEVTKNVELQVSDTEIAKIEEGKIIPLKAGKVTITATMMGGRSAAYTVIIEKQKPINSYLDVVNGDFEKVNEDSTIPGWSLSKGEDNIFSSTEKKVSGKRSLQLIDANTRGKTEYQSDLIEIQEGREYTAGVEVFISTKNKENATAKSKDLFQILYFDHSLEEIKADKMTDEHIQIPMDEWFGVSITSTAPKNAKYARLVLNGFYGWSTAEYYDDAYMYTVVEPSEMPKAELLPLEIYDIAEGDDLSLSVKATDGALIQVKEGDVVVAAGKGEGDNLVELNVSSPKTGAHHYQLEVSIPGIGTTTIEVPQITVHALANIHVDEAKVDLTVGGERAIKVTADYGPLQMDISDVATFTVNPEGIIKVDKNVISALEEGDATVQIAYAGKETEVNVHVSNYELEMIELQLPNKELAVGESIEASITATYSNIKSGQKETRLVNASLSSFSSAIAIDGMNITGLAAGEALVTATFQGKQTVETITVYNIGDPVKVYLNVENADFEKVNDDGSIPGWTVRSEEPGFTSIESSIEQALSGQRSIKLIDASTNVYTALQSELIEVNPGQEYTAGANVYLGNPPINPVTGNAFSSSRTMYQVRYYDANKVEINITAGLGTTFEAPLGRWIHKEFSSIAPANAKYIRILLSSSNAWVATAYYNDVYIYTMTERK